MTATKLTSKLSNKQKSDAQQPLILRAHRLIEAFAKSDDERDFYLDRTEGFIIYVDLDKTQEELDALYKELKEDASRYCMIPKMTFYDAKKIMEGFVTEKVYDIDTKEKLLDIIQSREARINFLEFIYDHHTELEKWQQYYQERSRIRIIDWLRQHHFHFVFEEDLEFTRILLEKLKHSLFDKKVGKDIQAARKTLFVKAKSYYSNEALNPRPKRGRPPKQIVKQEVEPQITSDIYLNEPHCVRPFLFIPEITSASGVNFASEFDHEIVARKGLSRTDTDLGMGNLQQKLASLRQLAEFDEDQHGNKHSKVSMADKVSAKTASSPQAKAERQTSPVSPPRRGSQKKSIMKSNAKRSPQPAPQPKRKALRPLQRIKQRTPAAVPTKSLESKRPTSKAVNTKAAKTVAKSRSARSEKK